MSRFCFFDFFVTFYYHVAVTSENNWKLYYLSTNLYFVIENFWIVIRNLFKALLTKQTSRLGKIGHLKLFDIIVVYPGIETETDLALKLEKKTPTYQHPFCIAVRMFFIGFFV